VATGLWKNVWCESLCITVSTEYRRVTDKRTNRQTDRHLATAYSPRYAYHRAVKKFEIRKSAAAHAQWEFPTSQWNIPLAFDNLLGDNANKVIRPQKLHGPWSGLQCGVNNLFAMRPLGCRLVCVRYLPFNCEVLG